MSDQTAQPDSTRPSRAAKGTSQGYPEGPGLMNRRGVLRAFGASAAVVGGGGLLSACSSSIKGNSSTSSTGGGSSSGKITIGWIHPLTGPLAGFGAPDSFVLSKIKATAPYKNGFKIGGKTYQVQVNSYDTQSSPTRAGQLAQQAINGDHVDMLLASSTPETVNAVASTVRLSGPSRSARTATS